MPERSRNLKPKLEVGGTYRIEHDRFGTFIARVLEDQGSHAAVEVVEGYARRLHGGTYGVGEQFTVLKLASKFTAVEPSANTEGSV